VEAQSEFNRDLDILAAKLHDGEPFSLVRFGDGEYHVLRGDPVDFTTNRIREFKYDPRDEHYRYYRDRLLESLTYRHEQYFVGVISPCCFRPFVESHRWMKRLSGQPETNLTWASIFTNANYEKALKTLVPEINRHKTIVVVNHQAHTSRLPFEIVKEYRVGDNAWVADYSVIEQIKSYVIQHRHEHHLFLFCAGPLSNIMVCQLHQLPYRNTYLNLGSVFDEMFYGVTTRKYHVNMMRTHHCEWA
jgi:hypothetical protein